MNSKIYEILQRSLKNISRNYIDEFVETNAEFRAKAGLREKIIRSTNGKCCKWCDKLAGIYDYPAPKDVYRRHDNCDCTVTYISEKGAQDVHTKNMLKAKEIEERITALENINTGDNAEIREWIRKNKRPYKKVQCEDGYDENRHKQEMKCAEWLSKMFGGDIICLNERETHKMPDFLWNGKAWEEKIATSNTSVDQRIRDAYHQLCGISDVEPGGIIITLKCEDSEIKNRIKAAENRFQRLRGSRISLIIKKGDRIIKILEK